jgi:hypothetical protein
MELKQERDAVESAVIDLTGKLMRALENERDAIESRHEIEEKMIVLLEKLEKIRRKINER